jgi:hypothetical protein
MNVVISRLMLGNRELGWECWSGKEVMEYTSKQLKDIILAGKQKVCGLKIGEDGELELDKDGFFTTNMTVHRHINNWETMNDESMANLLYTCIGSHEENGKMVYDCISSRFEQAVLTDSDMRAYLKIGIVSGGIKVDGDKLILAGTELEKPGKKKDGESVALKKEEAPKEEGKDTVEKVAVKVKEKK